MKHYIIVKFKEGVDWRSMTGEFGELFSSVQKIEGVLSVTERVSNSANPTRFDYMVEMDCTEKGLDNFLSSDEHREWKSRYGDLFERKAIFDCE